MYTLHGKDYALTYAPKECALSVCLTEECWQWGGAPYILLQNGEKLYFADAACASERKDTGVGEGVRAVYSNFQSKDGARPFTVTVDLWIERTGGDLHYALSADGEDGTIESIALPSFAFGAEEGRGYTVLSRMQGALIPAKYDMEITRLNQYVLDRPAYMPIFGQVRNASGYLAIFDTPFDCAYNLTHPAKGDTAIAPVCTASLGRIGYRRKMIYAFFNACDYNVMAKKYRTYLSERGRIVTLAQKIVKNPSVGRLIGTPVIHTGIAQHVHPQSHYYKPGDPQFNDAHTPFKTRANQLRKLHERGVFSAYLHLDGWGAHGYDNLHPDPFPPHKRAGGVEGMRALSDTCRELGFIFGIHDQYRDYYYDAESFSMDSAIQNGDGSHPFGAYWFGGPQTVMCAALAPDYVRRNYNEFDRLGIEIEGAYLDVFSVVRPDECFHPGHLMTRQMCAAARNHCFEILNARGIIPSSEETVDAYLHSIALCHHAPYYIKRLGEPESGAVGVNIPLFNLVYHDCVVIPWEGAEDRKRGGWGCPDTEWNFLHGLLNAGAPYLSIEPSDEEIKRVNILSELHRRVGMQRMLRHEFIDGTLRRQRTVFADGTTVEVDFDKDSWHIAYPD